MVVVTHERHVAKRAERIVHLLDGKIERIESLERAGPETEEDPTTERGPGY